MTNDKYVVIGKDEESKDEDYDKDEKYMHDNLYDNGTMHKDVCRKYKLFVWIK